MLIVPYLIYQIFRGCVYLIFYAFVGVFWLGWFILVALYTIAVAIYHAAETPKH